MVAPRKIRRIMCTVITVPSEEANCSFAQLRPSDRLPWSDPTIARLVNNLQDEVRGERRQAKLEVRTSHYSVADLDPPSPLLQDDFDWQEQPRWTWPD